MAIAHSCGIGAVYNPSEPIIRTLYCLGLGLQHRGPEAAGIGVYSNGDLFVHADSGSVNEVFHHLAKADICGDAGIVHTRYSTTGISGKKNVQPIRKGGIVLGHNGNLINTEQLHDSLGNPRLSTTTDSELLAYLFDDADNFYEGAQRCCELCVGTYNLVVLDKAGNLGIFRDPSGNHPLFTGTKKETFYAASEDFSLGHLGLVDVREVEPGELIVVSEKGIDNYRIGEGSQQRVCSFEIAYFMNHGSTVLGRSVDSIRREAGKRLAILYPVRADVVVPVPDSGISYASGFGDELGIPVRHLLSRNEHVGRVYMSPEGKNFEIPESIRMTREGLCGLKYIPIRSEINGRIIVVVDDSKVRSIVGRVVTESLRNAGAKEIHWRIGYPPVRYPCFFGMDHATRRELAAAGFEDPIEAGDHISREIGADSVRFLPKGEFRRRLGTGEACFACVDGHYFTEIPDLSRFQDALRLEQ